MKKITLSIPEPCYEDWNRMQPDACGRFCNVCQKTVIDFTVLTDEEILKVIAARTDRICGRLSEAQLNRPLEIPALRQPLSRKWSKIAAAAALLLPAFVTTVFAQKAATEQRPSQPVKGLLLQGVILDHLTGQPLVGMEIKVEGISYPKYSDKGGLFHFVLPDSFRGRTVYVSAQYHASNTPLERDFQIRTEKIVFGPGDQCLDVMLTRYPLISSNDTIKVLTYTPPTLKGGLMASGICVVSQTKKSKSIFYTTRQWIKHIFKKRS